MRKHMCEVRYISKHLVQSAIMNETHISEHLVQSANMNVQAIIL